MDPRNQEANSAGEKPRYRITYFVDSPTNPESCQNSPVLSDGGGPRDTYRKNLHDVTIETRERVAKVEQSVESIEGSVGRIETKVDSVATEVSELDDSALHKARFEDQFKHKILRNWRFWTILKWVGGVTIPLLMLGVALYQMW